MTEPGLWERAAALFDQALERPEDERTDFVAAAAGPDHVLRDRVLAMLRADARASPLLDATPDALAETVAPTQPALEGRQIGPYRVLRILGRGGMGVVCLAEREDVGKQAALKLVAGGLVSPDRVARFLQERRVLARLEHPNIARLLDAGVADDGTPWFAMEYVAGETLDRHCDRLSLPIERRLELFEKICAAVAYAHQHLVIHRDLKPANILVGDDGEPRLVDFGIAKLLADAAGEDEAATGTGVQLMTPMYASPEQLQGSPITTASDIYQLGALLYQLLTGQPPHPERTGRPTGAVAPRQLSRPSETAKRGSTRAAWARQLAGDLDVIVLKATDLDSSRRYATALELAADLSRHRRGLPIEARPASAAYRLRKLVARHKAGTGVAVAGILGLVSFAATLAVKNRRIEAERTRAEAVSTLLGDLFAGADPTVAAGDTITVESVLERGLERVRADAALDPVVKARLLGVIARASFNLGQLPRALELQTEVVNLLRGSVRPTDPLWLDALGWQAFWLAESGARERAYAPAEEAVRVARGLPVERKRDLARALREEGYARQRAGSDSTARARYDEALAIHRSLPAGPDPGLEVLLVNQGYLAQRRGDLALAAERFREVVDRRRARLGSGHLATANAMLNLAAALAGADLEEAERLVQEAVAVHRRIFTGPHRDRLAGLTALARVASARGRQGEAEAAQREGLALARHLYGDSSTAVAMAVANLAGYVQRQGRLDEAAILHDEAARRFRGLEGDGSPSAAVSTSNQAYTEFLRGRLAQSETLYRRSLPVLDSAWRATPRLSSTLVDFAMVLRRGSKCGEAEPVLRRALGLLDGRPRADVDVIRTQRVLGGCLADLGRYAAAESLLVAAHQTLQANWGDANPYTVDAAADLARLYRQWGRPAATRP